MPQVGHLIIHGTSQDIMSTNETTVRLARHLAESGNKVIEIGGPGSVESAMRLAQVGREEYTPIHEMDPGLDYGLGLVSGAAFGTGIEEIVEQGVAALKLLIEQGATSIKIIGFSRGAVASAMICDRLKNDAAMRRVAVTIALLDPVPGPFFVPKTLVIPGWVREVVLLTSRNEGRPGFNHLNVELGGRDTVLLGDTFFGVHGDIGGSTLSPVNTLAMDALVKKLRLPYPVKSDEELEDAFVQTWEDQHRFTAPRGMQSFSPRNFGWSNSVIDGQIEFASSDSATRFFVRNPLVHLLIGGNLSGAQSLLRQREMRAGEQAFVKKVWKQQQIRHSPVIVKTPKLPVVIERRVRIPPPVTASVPMIARVLPWLKFLK